VLGVSSEQAAGRADGQGIYRQAHEDGCGCGYGLAGWRWALVAKWLGVRCQSVA
jgi:hypothetical protein